MSQTRDKKSQKKRKRKRKKKERNIFELREDWRDEKGKRWRGCSKRRVQFQE